MQLFSGNSVSFIRPNRDNTIANSLKIAFFEHFGYNQVNQRTHLTTW